MTAEAPSFTPSAPAQPVQFTMPARVNEFVPCMANTVSNQNVF
jgi:hypothetical protein